MDHLISAIFLILLASAITWIVVQIALMAMVIFFDLMLIEATIKGWKRYAAWLLASVYWCLGMSGVLVAAVATVLELAGLVVVIAQFVILILNVGTPTIPKLPR